MPVVHTLNDGTTLPLIGFGTYPMKGREARRAVRCALDAGYRLIDTAAMYENEPEVGQALRDSAVDRRRVRIQTKLPVGSYGTVATVGHVQDALHLLRLDIIDVMLIHWPIPGLHSHLRQWEGLVQARERGLVRTIGVSNFSDAQLARIVEATGVTPAVNQVRLNPRHPGVKVRAENAARGILVQAYRPLGKGRGLLGAQPVRRAALDHGVTPAQVVLRWHLQLGTLPLPTSSDPARRRSNLDLDGFALSTSEVHAITALR